MSRRVPKSVDVRFGRAVRVGVVAARFNAHIVEELLAGCLKQLEKLGAAGVDVQRVPGAFELPLAAQAMARTGRYAVIIALGAVVRGQTPHFDFVAGECARGIMRVSLDEHLPVIFGVLTTNTEKQAWDRAGGRHGHAGIRAADAAAEMVETLKKLRPIAGRRREP